MRISDWSSDVCSSDLATQQDREPRAPDGRERQSIYEAVRNHAGSHADWRMPAKEPQGSFRYRQPPSHQEGHWLLDLSGLSPHRSEGHVAVFRRHHCFVFPSRVPGGFFLLIGLAHVLSPFTNSHLVFLLLLYKYF